MAAGPQRAACNRAARGQAAGRGLPAEGAEPAPAGSRRAKSGTMPETQPEGRQSASGVEAQCNGRGTATARRQLQQRRNRA
eukprot:14058548-Alexandrium_andersonii.AAC.1